MELAVFDNTFAFYHTIQDYTTMSHPNCPLLTPSECRDEAGGINEPHLAIWIFMTFCSFFRNNNYCLSHRHRNLRDDSTKKAGLLEPPSQILAHYIFTHNFCIFRKKIVTNKKIPHPIWCAMELIWECLMVPSWFLCNFTCWKPIEPAVAIACNCG